MFNDDIAQVLAFFAEKDADGISNLKKAKTRSKVIRRVAATDKSKSYEAYPIEGFHFVGWRDARGALLSDKAIWIDEYGQSRILTACFERK